MARRLAAFAAFAALAAAPSPAYYHFIHYLSTGNAPLKFDLAGLRNNTVTFLVSESGPAAYTATDTFNSVVAQIQQAARVWNGVGSSDLRVTFGGLENDATAQNTAGGDVVFEDLPPGVEGLGGPTSLTAAATAADGSQYFPIVRSVVHLNRNLTLAPGPSFSQSFFMTTVHEMGHALGLQHTFTSSTMSQDTTRATNLTHPLDNDDIAGISALYPNAGFKRFGSIAGRITQGGKGVHLASVVAIRSGAGAVSAVTNPDGSYRIDGVPAGQYAVYVHTLPPDANIDGPWNADGTVAAASGPVNSVFYPGTTDWSQASQIAVTAGQASGGVDIAVSSRAAVPLYDGQIFGFFGAAAVRPAPVSIASTGLTTVTASVNGFGSTGAVPGLSVQVPGGAVGIATRGVRPYAANGFTYVALDIRVNAGAQPGPQHVIFTTADYMYVLPSALYLTRGAPPSVTGVTPNGDGTLTVTGANWDPGVLLCFDGLPATIAALDAEKGVAVVTPPAGISGQQSTVIAYSSDGQNSQFVQADAPATYTYDAAAAPLITGISPASLPRGAEAMVDITGSGFALAQGLTSVGFGSSDVLVRGVFVLSPNHVQVDVSVAPGAALAYPDVSVLSGFQLASAPAGFQTAAAIAGLPAPIPTLVNAYALSGLTGAWAGAVVSLYGSNLALPNRTSASIAIGGQGARILYWSPAQINLIIPAGLPAGPAVLALNNGALNAFPIVVNIDPPPAGFSAVQKSTGAYIDADLAARQGDILIATMNHFAPDGSAVALNRVSISLGGVARAPTKITQIGSVWQITFPVADDDPVGTEQLIVYLDGRSSYPATIQVAHADGSFTPSAP